MEITTESSFASFDYEQHQAAEDEIYRREYARWVSTLSESDRARLVADGLIEPCTGFIGQTGHFGKLDRALAAGGVGDENGKQVPTSDAILPTDTDQDQLRALGLSDQQSEAVLQWVAARSADAISDLASDRLARFFALLMPTNSKHKINLSLLGARALAGVFLMNRLEKTSLSELAARAGMSKQLLDFHTRRLEDCMGFHGFAQKGVHTREVYSQAAKDRWSTLTPAERRARRRGAKGIIGTQQTTNDDQNLTVSTAL
jgi:hypothetical protein